MELLAIQYGLQGLFMYIEMVLPHGIFYALGFICLGCWCVNMEVNPEKGIKQKMEKIQKVYDLKRLLAALVVVFIGIVLESYANF